MPFLYFRFLAVFVFLSILFTTTDTVRAASLSLPFGNGDQVPIERFEADGDTLILWTPSSFGVQPPARSLAQELTFSNIETWLPDLHDAYFIPRGPGSIKSFRPKDLAGLIDQTLKQSNKSELFLMTTGNGAKVVLQAARLWQLDHPGSNRIRGLILFHPTLYGERPALGETARYLDVVSETNLPIFIIQPTLSTTYMRVTELQQRLQSGGSQVYLRIIEGVRDGFHLRPDDLMAEADFQARAKLSGLVPQAIRALRLSPAPTHAAPEAKKTQSRIDTPPGLKPYTHKRNRLPLGLPDLNGKFHRLEDYRGKVVLVSFWASWCPPCIREMPSMNRLQARLKGEGLVIIGVNIGEKPSAIRSFLKQNKIGFTVLLDELQQAYTDWKVYVVPSNYVIDTSGRIRLGSAGGIDWDSDEVVATIRQLLREPPSRK